MSAAHVLRIILWIVFVLCMVIGAIAILVCAIVYPAYFACRDGPLRSL